MVVPNWLVIGCKRSGSTLLHELFTAHRSIYVPTRRKELQFFDMNWNRGLEWYDGFFPKNSTGYASIGEVTPGYVFAAKAPLRVRAVLGYLPQLVVMVRHPADQAWSWWRHDRAAGRLTVSFEAWFDERRIDQLSTGRHLERWLEIFPRPCFHIMVFEEFLVEPFEHLHWLARFLNVADDWPGAVALLAQPVNRAPAPSMPRIVALKIAAWARRANLDQPVNIVKRFWPARGTAGPAMPDDVRAGLHEQFLPDMARTEAILGKRIGAWHWPRSGPAPEASSILVSSRAGVGR